MSKRSFTWCIGCLAAVGLCTAAVVGDEVAQPWGTVHGNLSGTAASDHPTLRFNTGAWSAGAVIDWAVPLRDASINLDRIGGWASLTFDEAGNIYFRCSSGGPLASAQVASFSETGALRWKGTTDGSTNHLLGAFRNVSVVVGDGGPGGRCYCTGIVGADVVAVAYSKATGIVAWQTALPGANNPDITPALYNGKLYVLDAPTGGTANVFQLDSATGAIDWASTVAVAHSTGGQMAFVPDAFGPGQHGLYFNVDSGNGSDSIAEIYALKIDPTPGTGSAVLQWSSDGGKVARSHVIHMASLGRVATHTWADYGSTIYSWNLDGSSPNGFRNQANSGHGFYDVGCLDFNGVDILAGGFDGRIVRYKGFAANSGPAADEYYETVSWYGEPRVLGGLYKATNGNSILITGTNSRSDLGPDRESRVIAADMTTAPPNSCFTFDDAPLYVDNLKITGNISGTILDVAGFTGYATGNLPGQENSAQGGTGVGNWVDDTGGGGSAIGQPQIVSSPPPGAPGGGNAAAFDATGGCGGWQGAAVELPATTTDTLVTVEWDQYRADLLDNVWVANNWDPGVLWNGWWAIHWDSNGSAYARQFDGTPVGLTAGVWQHITYVFDFTDPDPLNHTVSVSVDGGPPQTAFLDPGNPNEHTLKGWNFEIEGTSVSVVPPNVTTPIVTFNTGQINNHGFLEHGGPLLGPKVAAPQHIYYTERVSPFRLVALKPAGAECNTPPQDVDGDGDVDLGDFATFQGCFNGPNRPYGASPACACLDDAPADNDVDLTDFAKFQSCFNGPNRPPNC